MVLCKFAHRDGRNGKQTAERMTTKQNEQFVKA